MDEVVDLFKARGSVEFIGERAVILLGLSVYSGTCHCQRGGCGWYEAVLKFVEVTCQLVSRGTIWT